jgi:hypothetical protein
VEKFIHVIGSRIRDLPACSMVLLPTTLWRATITIIINFLGSCCPRLTTPTQVTYREGRSELPALYSLSLRVYVTLNPHRVGVSRHCVESRGSQAPHSRLVYSWPQYRLVDFATYFPMYSTATWIPVVLYFAMPTYGANCDKSQPDPYPKIAGGPFSKNKAGGASS